MVGVSSSVFKGYDIRGVIGKTFDIGIARQIVQTFSTAVRVKGKRIVTIDGLRVEYTDGFGLVCSSNIAPVVVMRFEGESAQALSLTQQDFKRAILSSKPEAV